VKLRSAVALHVTPVKYLVTADLLDTGVIIVEICDELVNSATSNE
jgi:hypothetical protein